MITASSAPASLNKPRPVFALLNTHRLVVAILFVLLFAMAVRIPTDTDTWWHLRTGAYMLDGGGVPLTDPFSFTRSGQPWVNHSWGSQIVMTAGYRLFGGTAGGNWGLAIYTALLATAGMAFVYLMCEGNAYLRAFVVVLGAAAAAVFWSPRPQMMSFLLSAALLYVLHLYKRHGLDRLWVIVPMMIVWVNLHAGYFIGFILLAGFVAGEALGRLFDSKNPAVLTWPKIGRVVLVTVLSYAALVINPNTTQMWGYSFRTFGIGVLQQFIQEWASPDFHGRETWPFVFLLLGVLAAAGLSNRRIDWTDLTLTCGTAFMALYAGRNISTFALVAVPVLSRHLNAIFEERGLRLPRPRPARGSALLLNWLLLGLIILGAGAKIAITLEPAKVAQAQAESLPVKAAEFLNTARPAGPMFNSYNWGGYLMFAVPGLPVFVDGRTDLYDDTLLTQWLDAATGKEWTRIFERWGIRLVVIEHESALASLLRAAPGWQAMYQDEQAVIFQKQP